MASDVEIASKALLKLGEGAISSFDDGTDKADTCKELYPDFKKYCLSLHDWNFAKKKVQLNRLVDTPVNEYKYAYQVPSDMIKLLGLYDNAQVGATPFQDYNIFYKQVYTDVAAVYADYIALVNDEDFPAYFVEFLATAFAAELALSITDKEEYHSLFYRKAYGSESSAASSGILGRAKFIDSKQSPPAVIRYNGLLAERFRGSRK